MRKVQKAATRRALRDAAVQVWAQDGFDETTIGEVTRAAGVAHGTFYVHFASKEALLDELLAEFNAALATQLVTRWSQVDPDQLDTLVEVAADAFLDAWDAHRDFVRIYARRLSGGLGIDQLRDGINPPALTLLSARLQPVVGDDAPLVAHAILAMWLRIGLQYLFSPTVDRAQARRVLITLTLGALGVST